MKQQLKPQAISEAQRLQYLQAMGIEPWISRARAARMGVMQQNTAVEEPDADLSPGSPPQHADQRADLAPASRESRYIIGPGSGRTLLLCESPEQAASTLASDIARCLDEVPVWAWRTPSGRQAATEQVSFTLESAIEDRLFTRVLLFSGAAGRKSADPEVIGSARIIRAPALPELASNPQQKRALWLQLVQYGWAARRA